MLLDWVGLATFPAISFFFLSSLGREIQNGELLARDAIDDERLVVKSS